jgi:hypothetical protein
MLSAPAGVPRLHVGPVQVRLALSALGRRPSGVKSMNAKGVEWRVQGDSFLIDLQSIGVHGMLIIT